MSTMSRFRDVQRRLRVRRVRRQRRLHPLATPTDVAMMERALALAAAAARQAEVPVGAVIYRGDEVIAEAANNREQSKDPTGHAELVALRAAGKKLDAWRLRECSMAVTLEPCPMCAGALVNARISRLVYGASDPKAGACHSLFGIPADTRLNHRVEMIGGVLERACATQLTGFFRALRRAKKTKKSAE
jgi:tRNA(adenine34) deaminase